MATETPDGGALPVTAEQWRRYLPEYSDWYLRDAPEHFWVHMGDPERRIRSLAREPATEQQLAATEERLGVRLPPSLRGFLLASNGWGPVSVYTDVLCPCEEIEWFRDADEAFMDGYESGAADMGEEISDDDIFLHTLNLAWGEDTILLDTRSASADGEYEAYLFATKYGELHEPCASFSAVIAKGRKEIEDHRARR